MNRIAEILREGPQRRLAQADRVIDLCRKMYPVKGLIVSPDITRAFAQLKAAYPEIEIHSYPTGATAEDWEVPMSWEAVKGIVKAEDGRVLASLDESFLMVAAYSEPVNGWFSKAEIAKRVRTDRNHPQSYSLEHRNAYNHALVDWGITLPDAVWEAMPEDGRFHVEIETRVKPGVLQVASAVLPGRRPETICLCSQFDELCNDGQSSAVFAAELIEHLKTWKDREFTYHVLLVPEMFGTLFFAHHNKELLDRTVAMFNLETLGAGRQWTLKKALRHGGSLEQALEAAFVAARVPFAVADYFGAFSNDERVYGWPNLGIPGPALQRHPFDDYHTQADTPDILDRKFLAEAFLLCELTLAILEANTILKFNGRLPPWLTKHNLYFDATRDPERYRKFNSELLYNIDGTRSLLRLANEIGVPIDALSTYMDQFKAKNLLGGRPLTFAELRQGA
ncbi:MAG: DUF4910 domain-containing protein [Rhodospirillaceae bacterium]|nr:DUF4910 domain-containing protein [Rhodospirillaceae bacterium]